MNTDWEVTDFTAEAPSYGDVSSKIKNGGLALPRSPDLRPAFKRDEKGANKGQPKEVGGQRPDGLAV
jgi:hypothetical protein